jgi:hypothetical protein
LIVGKSYSMTETPEVPDDVFSFPPDEMADDPPASLRRRTILKRLMALGVGTTTFRRALAAQAAQGVAVTPDMIKQAEWIAGLDLTAEERTHRVRGGAGLDVLPDSATACDWSTAEPGRAR